MEVKNPMDLSNLLNSEPTEFKEEDNPSTYSSDSYITAESLSFDSKLLTMTFKGIYSIPSPPASDYSPRSVYQQPVLPPLVNSTARMPDSPPSERRELAIRPRFKEDRDPYYQEYREQAHLQLPPIAMLNIKPNPGPFREQNDPGHDAARRGSRSSKSHNRFLVKHSQRKLEANPGMVSSMNTFKGTRIRSRPRKRDTTHSNAKYTDEQVDYIRYYKEDLDVKYKDIEVEFDKVFPGEKRETDQCFSSRTYRDHWVPIVTEDWELTFDTQGKVRTKPAKVRDRKFPEFREVPYKFVERSPRRALEYDWVSREHKMKAIEILEQDEREAKMDCLSETGNWRRVILLAERHKAVT